MKKILVLLFLFMAVWGNAQSGITYQAVIMSPTGGQLPGADNPKSPLINASICLRFSITSDPNPTPITTYYQETLSASTNEFGVVNAIIGTGTSTGVGSATSFGAISWNGAAKYLVVELDHTGSCTGSNTFLVVSRQPFTTVPIALYALNSGSGGGSSTTTLTGDVIGSGSGSFTTALAPSGVTPGVYGSATEIPTITVDAKGRITSATTTPIAGTSPIGSALNNGNIIIGDVSNVATAVPVTGDISITNAGVTAIGSGKVDNTKLDKTNIPLSGFGVATANIDLGGNKLSGVADPTLAQDATTKSYVDAKIADGITNTVTTSAPTQNAVYDALALKEDAANKTLNVATDGTSDLKFPSAKAVKTYADTKVANTILDDEINSAPTQNAVYDALALKAPLSSPTFTGVITLNGSTTVSGGNSFIVETGATSLGGTLGVTGATTIGGATKITSVLEYDVSTTTGALIVDGGVGIAKNLNVGGTLKVNKIEVINSVINTTGTTTINAISGRFRILSSTDNTIVTNNKVNSSSIIICTIAKNSDLTRYYIVDAIASTNSFKVTINGTPGIGDFVDINFLVIN
jgi:hypothetical protein